MAVMPKISVIIASKNGGRFLRQTLDSIIGQSFTDHEIVVADSLSTDDTLDILQDYKRNGHNIIWKSEADRHTDEGLYKAMTMARGQYIMLCCISDGYLDRDWFGGCVEILDNDPDVSLVHGLYQCMSEDGTLGEIAHSNFLSQPPPQKMDFLPFWLGTFWPFSEITYCARADVFKVCFPKYEPTGYFLQNHAFRSFIYNFNTKGYLPHFLPVVAGFARAHHDSSSIRLAKLNSLMKRQNKSAIIRYGNEVLPGKRKHVFRDSKSNVIKPIEPNELKFYRQKVLDYRINRRAYIGRRTRDGMGSQIRKFKILMEYFLCGHHIYD